MANLADIANLNFLQAKVDALALHKIATKEFPKVPISTKYPENFIYTQPSAMVTRDSPGDRVNSNGNFYGDVLGNINVILCFNMIKVLLQDYIDTSIHLLDPATILIKLDAYEKFRKAFVYLNIADNIEDFDLKDLREIYGSCIFTFSSGLIRSDVVGVAGGQLVSSAYSNYKAFGVTMMLNKFNRYGDYRRMVDNSTWTMSGLYYWFKDQIRIFKEVINFYERHAEDIERLVTPDLMEIDYGRFHRMLADQVVM